MSVIKEIGCQQQASSYFKSKKPVDNRMYNSWKLKDPEVWYENGVETQWKQPTKQCSTAFVATMQEFLPLYW